VNGHSAIAYKLNDSCEATFALLTYLKYTMWLLAEKDEHANESYEEWFIGRIERSIDENGLAVWCRNGTVPHDVRLVIRTTLPETRFLSGADRRRPMRSTAATAAVARRSSAGRMPSAEMISEALAFSSGIFREGLRPLIFAMLEE
jgi:hypothetical protein